jgi:hypothetical protein
MPTPSAYIGGVPILASSSVNWSLREGLSPVTESFDVTPGDADAFERNYRLTEGVSLSFGSVTATKLAYLGRRPGPHQYISRLVIADHRYWWNNIRILRRFNMRRVASTKRVGADDQAALQPTAPEIVYAPYSLRDSESDKPSTTWTAQSALDSIFYDIRNHSPIFFGWRFAGDWSKTEQPFEDVQVDAPGAAAVQQILAMLPGAGLFVDYDGTVIIYNKADGAEERIVRGSGPEHVGGGHIDFVDHGFVMPSSIEVLFTREVEVRFDCFEDTSARSAGTQSARGVDDRFMDNVLPIPDWQLTLAASDGGKVLTQGTYLDMSAYFRAIGTPPHFNRPMDHEIVQKALVPYIDFWAGFLLFGSYSPDADWTSRVSAIQSHYRRTYRLNRRWVDRCFQIKAHRLGTIDPVSGQRAPSPVYSDHAFVTTMRSFLASGKKGDWVINKKSYPLSGNLDSTVRAAPCNIIVADADQGIVHLDYRLDPWKLYEIILPSMVTLSKGGEDSAVDSNGLPVVAGPTSDITDRSRPICWNAVRNSALGQLPKLTATHKVMSILSCVPAAPNSQDQLHKIIVRPADVEKLVPDVARASLSKARGPKLQIRINPGLEVARVRWLDARASDIEKCFGIGAGTPQLKDLILNEGDTDFGTGASLNVIAKAAAAATYAWYVSRYEGAATFAMNPDARPAGWLGEVRHSLHPNGILASTLALPASPEKLDMMAFMDAGTRAVILKLVQSTAAK